MAISSSNTDTEAPVTPVGQRRHHRGGLIYAGKADMALLFRDIQKSVMPELTTERYQDAFDDWLSHDLEGPPLAMS